MPRVAIPITTPGQAGAVEQSTLTSDAANDHYLPNNGHVLLQVENVGGGAESITIITPGLFGGLNVEDLVVSITNGSANKKYLGPFAPGLFNQADGTVYIDVTSANMRFRAWSLG